MNKIILLAFFLSLGCMAHDTERIISVKGKGVLNVRPDLIQMTYSVYSHDAEAPSKAKANVDAISSRSVEALIKLGIASGDISSSSLGVEKTDHYNRKDKTFIPAYVATREIDIIIRDIGLYGKVFQALVYTKISEIDSVSPGVSNYNELEESALVRAAEDANRKAIFLANKFDAKVGKVHQIGIREVRNNIETEEVLVVSARRRDKVALYDFKPGNLEITSEIYVEYLLK